MKTRSFGTIIIGDRIVTPGFRMGKQHHHLQSLDIRFGNSTLSTEFNILWDITNDGLFQAREPVIKAVNERFVEQNNLGQDGQIVFIDRLAYELSFMPAVIVEGTGRDIRPQLKPVSEKIGMGLCGKDLMIWTKDLVPIVGHLVEMSEYDLLLRDSAPLVVEHSRFISFGYGVTTVDINGLLSVQIIQTDK